MKIRYLTDTGTGKSKAYFNAKGIDVLPLQIAVDDHSYADIEEYDTSRLYDDLRKQKIVRTSMPSYGLIDEYFQQCQKDHVDLVVASPICPGLSGCYDAIISCAQAHHIPLKIINHYVTAVVQEYILQGIKTLVEANCSEAIIRQFVDETIESTNTVMIPVDLDHLKRGGRLTPMAATLASLLKISPVMQINKGTNGKVDVLAKIRTMRKAVSYVEDLIVNDCVDSSYLITIAHIDSLDLAKRIEKDIKQRIGYATVQIIPLCNSVSAHIGLHGIAFQYFKMTDFTLLQDHS